MSSEQRSYDEVDVGMELPPLQRGPFTIKDLVKFAAATRDYSEIHFDESVARARGLPAPVVHGPLKSALLARMLTNWTGAAGTLKRLACQYRQVDAVGETITCRGKVTRKSVGDGEGLVECEVWTENSRGEITTRGSALLGLPVRPAAGAKASRKEGSVSSDGSPVSLITDQMRKELRLGEVGGTFTYEVDRKWIRQFAATFDDPNPLWRDEAYARHAGRFGAVIAPPTFFAALDPVETRELLLDPWVETIPYKDTGGGNAFNEV